MQTKGSKYLGRNIRWKRTADPRYPFVSENEDEKWVIRLNDFPDAHLYTLIVNGKEVVSFDDWSEKWNRPSKEKGVNGESRKSVDARAKRRPSSKVA
jgi:hypothetical protein